MHERWKEAIMREERMEEGRKGMRKGGRKGRKKREWEVWEGRKREQVRDVSWIRPRL